MKRVFYISGSVSLIFIAISIFYYLVIFLPQKESLNLQQQKEIELQKENANLLSRYRSECLEIDNSNSKVFENAVKNYKNEQCVQSVQDSLGGISGNQFIKSCIENRIKTFGLVSSSTIR